MAQGVVARITFLTNLRVGFLVLACVSVPVDFSVDANVGFLVGSGRPGALVALSAARFALTEALSGSHGGEDVFLFFFLDMGVVGGPSDVLDLHDRFRAASDITRVGDIVISTNIKGADCERHLLVEELEGEGLEVVLVVLLNHDFVVTLGEGSDDSLEFSVLVLHLALGSEELSLHPVRFGGVDLET